jgi:Predicted O-methyltransferase
MTGIELDEKAAALAKTNMEHNGLENRSEIICGDIRDHRKLFSAGSFDFVISNPPYFPLCSGVVSPNIRRAAARGEVTCTLEDICAAAEYLCRWDGKLYIVYKPERLVELFACMCEHGIEPKRMRVVSHEPGAVPSLVLVEGRRGGRPGMKLEPGLYLCNPDGTETDEIKTIYHRE